MNEIILGTRIRQRRREMGTTQSDLAKKIGISASYLNLIEWNKRRIAGTLLKKIADALELSLDSLDDITERRLLSTLSEVAHLGPLEGSGIEESRTGELIGRFPGWAKAIATLARSERDARNAVQSLSDRLSNDPFLGEEVHRMLTRVSVIRSVSEILIEYPDISSERRDRFNNIIHEEIGLLSNVGEALAAYLDKSEHAEHILTPTDEVESLLNAYDNHFDVIERATRELKFRTNDPHPVSRREKARALSEERLGDVIDTVIKSHPAIETASARDRARRALSDYAAGSILMPMNSFTTKAIELRYDVEALAEAFSTDVDAVCRRLTALPPGENIPKIGYFRANAAGTTVEVLGVEGLNIPKYSSACPLWVLYRAQQSPEAFIRQRALFPWGARFIFVARARNTGTTGFGKPRHYLTDMIAMSEADAAHTIYAPDHSSPVEEVGPNCRLCPRRTCSHRVEDLLAD